MLTITRNQKLPQVLGRSTILTNCSAQLCANTSHLWAMSNAVLSHPVPAERTSRPESAQQSPGPSDFLKSSSFRRSPPQGVTDLGPTERESMNQCSAGASEKCSTRVNISSVPDELRRQPQRVNWRCRCAEGKGKRTQIPLNPRTGGEASCGNASAKSSDSMSAGCFLSPSQRR